MSRDQVAIDMTYDRDEKIMPSEALKKAAAATSQPVVCVIVEHANDSDRSMQFLAIYPIVPRVGEMIVLENGVSATVSAVIHKIVLRDSEDGSKFRQAACYIHCRFID